MKIFVFLPNSLYFLCYVRSLPLAVPSYGFGARSNISASLCRVSNAHLAVRGTPEHWLALSITEKVSKKKKPRCGFFSKRSPRYKELAKQSMIATMSDYVAGQVKRDIVFSHSIPFCFLLQSYGLFTTPMKRGRPSRLVRTKRKGRSRTKSISSLGGAAEPAPSIRV